MEEPAENAEVEEPLEVSGVEEPVEVAETEEPVEVAETEEPVEVAETEEPIKVAETEEPAKNPVDIDDILNDLNGLTLNGTAKVHENLYENGYKNGYENGYENGHENGHQNGTDNGESSLEEGEIRDESTVGSEEEKVVLKACQETISSGVTQQEDPAKWNLLELPKPVNPHDLPVPTSEKGIFSFILLFF